MEMTTGFGERMQVETSDRSSSSLSPPISPQAHNFADTIRVARPPFSNPGLSGEGVANSASATSAQPAVAASKAAHTQNGNAATKANGTAPDKPKRQRKKKEVGADGKPIDDGKPKERKPRKPRELKDKPAGSTTTAPRKRQKTEEKPPHDSPAPAPSRQPTITETFNNFPTPMPPTSIPIPPRPQHSTSLPLPPSNPQTPRPISSGQSYDPVRGAVMEIAQSRPANTSNGTPSAQASPHVNRASASPSISSLIDPPMATKTSASALSYSPQTAVQQPFVPSQPRSPTPPKPTLASFAPPPVPKSPSVPMTKPAAIPNLDGAMDIDLRCDAPKPPPEITAPSKSSSSAPTPKAAKPTPPKGTGSGLLSSSDLFGGPSSNEGAERKGVNIDLHIPLNPQGGNTINIAQEIFRKYGRDAINPRAAAHREQLLQVAAAANKIDGGSADDMSVDLMSDMGDDSNVEMGGMDEDKSHTGADADGKVVRRRRKKIEEYDKEDDFIDDTEMAWQEQQAVAKDGFFVYSGPLMPPGEAPTIETSAPTRGGRGRGRGRGARGGAAAAAATGTTHASLAADKTRDPNAPPTRARGRGRGTGAPRKPRITKADRERMEAEKMERERAAQHIGGPTTGASAIPLAPTPTPLQQQGYGAPQPGSAMA